MCLGPGEGQVSLVLSPEPETHALAVEKVTQSCLSLDPWGSETLSPHVKVKCFRFVPL